MADSQPARRKLLTRDQVIAALRQERGEKGLTRTAQEYGLRPQQLCDVLSVPPRARLSKRMVEALRYRLHELYEKVDKR